MTVTLLDEYVFDVDEPEQLEALLEVMDKSGIDVASVRDPEQNVVGLVTTMLRCEGS